MKDQGYSTSGFKPADVKPKGSIVPSNQIKRRAGEKLNGDLSPEQRFKLALADKIQSFDKAIYRRWSWMAFQAMLHGKVVVEGEEYPKREVDFNRDPSHEVTLAGSEKWSDPTADIQQQLEEASQATLTNSGYAGDMVLLAQKAWSMMTQNDAFKEQFTRYKGSDVVPNVSPQVAKKVAFKGYWGEFPIFVVSYKDKIDGVATQAMPENTCLVVSIEGMKGTRCFGAILDNKSLRATDIFRK